jgi:hypothetical protein
VESVSENRSPFDFDDEDNKDKSSHRTPFYKKLLRGSSILAVVSFLVALIGSIIGNNATGDRDLEFIAFALNRWGMLAMLIGCFGIFIAFRGPQLQRLSSFKTGSLSKWSPWWTLFVWSIIGWFALGGILIGLTFLFGNGSLFFISALLPFAVPLLLVMTIWHKGVIRAYAIGFLSSLMIGLLSAFPLIWSFGFSALWMSTGNMYNPSPYSYNSNPYFGPGNVQWSVISAVLGQLFFAALSGLVCSGYVSRLERFQAALVEAKSDDLPQ